MSLPSWLQTGLTLTFYGLGLVFALLGVLWAVIRVLVRLDHRRDAGRSAADAPACRPPPPALTAAITAADGQPLDPAVVAAVMIAVRAHVRTRRKQAAPAMRAHPPGSLPSRWVAVGRGRQTAR
jgi:Na+-transporting methylmalonyl-CoA/oxaloacetate decarboxylase gamma subunit